MRGFALGGLLGVLAFMGLTEIATVATWRNQDGRAATASAARTTQVSIFRARMLSIYEGLNHFVVVDPETRQVEIYSDSGSTAGSFDAGDALVSGESLAAGIDLDLPARPPSLSSPLDSTSLNQAWSLPSPDAQARWGTRLLGLMTTPDGLVRSAEATPRTIDGGLIVFSSAGDDTAAVGILGKTGAIKFFEFADGRWIEL